MRRNLSSGTSWEQKVGYSRMVVQDKMAFVSGTTAVDENGKVVGEEHAAAQAEFIYQKIEGILNKGGFNLADVVRVRIYVVQISDFEEIGKVHHAVFKNILPAATLVEVSALVDPGLLVEIEVDAIKDSE